MKLQKEMPAQTISTDSNLRRETAAQIYKIIYANAKDFDAFDCKLRLRHFRRTQLDKRSGHQYKYDKDIAYIIIPNFLVEILHLQRSDLLEVAIRKLKGERNAKT